MRIFPDLEVLSHLGNIPRLARFAHPHLTLASVRCILGSSDPTAALWSHQFSFDFNSLIDTSILWVRDRGDYPFYCSRTILPLAYSKRFNLDRNDRPSRFSDSASSGSTMASTSRTTRPPISTIASRVRAALTLPLAVVTVAL